jgi:Flp pilus assembly pilin Flp
VVDRLQRARSESAQTMAEYAVVLSVITISVIVTVGSLSTTIAGKLTSTVNVL